MLRSLWLPVQRDPERPHNPADQPGAWHSSSSGKQDRLIMALLGNQRRGYFVELAANVPIVNSNTRALERDFAWRGVCIEADPAHHLPLLEQRSCTVVGAAISDVPSTVGFAHRGHMGMGGLVLPGTVNQNHTRGVVRVQTVSLGSVLRAVGAPATIDYLSLDVEGAEETVMRSFPFADYTIRAMTIERPQDRLKDRLTRHGYSFLCGNKLGAPLCLPERTMLCHLADTHPPMRRRVLGTSNDVAGVRGANARCAGVLRRPTPGASFRGDQDHRLQPLIFAFPAAC